MLEAFNGQRSKTAKFNNFTISLATLSKIQNATTIRAENELIVETADYFFEQEVISKHKHLSFQEPDKVADALSSIWEESQKWQKIANQYSVLDRGLSETNLKETLKKIVFRRNQIVHEADIDLQTHERNNIDETEVKTAIDFIEKLGESIFHCVNPS